MTCTPAPSLASSGVEHLVDLPRLEHGPCNLEPIGQHDQFALKLPTVLEHHEHDPSVLREHRRVDHLGRVGVAGDVDHGPSAVVC